MRKRSAVAEAIALLTDSIYSSGHRLAAAGTHESSPAWVLSLRLKRCRLRRQLNFAGCLELGESVWVEMKFGSSSETLCCRPALFRFSGLACVMHLVPDGSPAPWRQYPQEVRVVIGSAVYRFENVGLC